MTFVYPLLLGGLVLVGVPVLLHLIMRQKPKHLLFPAVRFLLQKQRTNQRKLQLRHLLLLALRILLIALVCLALARPKVFSQRLNLLSTDRPVAAVLVFDTSPSMEYVFGGRSRLDEAKRRAQELLDEFPDSSRVAVLTTAEQGGEWQAAPSQARERIAGLEVRAFSVPVTTLLPTAYDLLAKLEQEIDPGEEMPRRFIYVFSDRTPASWNANQLENLQRLRDRIPQPGATAVYVDLGVDEPADVAVAGLELPKQVVAANERMVIKATVRATGKPCDTVLVCRIDGEAKGEQKPVQLQAGESRTVTFERRGLAPGWHQGEVALATGDELPYDNTAFATFEVVGPRKVLVLTDEPGDAKTFRLALESVGTFACEVKAPNEVKLAGPADLADYKAVCLLNVADPSPGLWEVLDKYVQEGGGLAVIPGEHVRQEAGYGSEAAKALLPGTLVGLRSADPKGEPIAEWTQLDYRHPLLAPFKGWSLRADIDFYIPGRQPVTRRYWQVDPENDQAVLVRYGKVKGEPPALLEKTFDHKKYRGHVLLFTTPLDDAPMKGNKPWHNYATTSFYPVLVNLAVGYLAGDMEGKTLNYAAGQPVAVALPAAPRFPAYTLQGPGITANESSVPRAESQGELQITKAVMPGNYTVADRDGNPVGRFSMNVPAEECLLAKVPAEQVEALFGKGAVLALAPDTKTPLRQVIESHWAQPIELLPVLMLVVLVALAVENFLANRFYRREPEEAEAAA